MSFSCNRSTLGTFSQMNCASSIYEKLCTLPYINWNYYLLLSHRFSSFKSLVMCLSRNFMNSMDSDWKSGWSIDKKTLSGMQFFIKMSASFRVTIVFFKTTTKFVSTIVSLIYLVFFFLNCRGSHAISGGDVRVKMKFWGKQGLPCLLYSASERQKSSKKSTYSRGLMHLLKLNLSRMVVMEELDYNFALSSAQKRLLEGVVNHICQFNASHLLHHYCGENVLGKAEYLLWATIFKKRDGYICLSSSHDFLFALVFSVATPVNILCL